MDLHEFSLASEVHTITVDVYVSLSRAAFVRLGEVCATATEPDAEVGGAGRRKLGPTV